MATLNINPSTLASVTLNPTSVQGGSLVDWNGDAEWKGAGGRGGGGAIQQQRSGAGAGQRNGHGGCDDGHLHGDDQYGVELDVLSPLRGHTGLVRVATLTVTPVVLPGTVLFGDQAIESQKDSNTAGQAEAFQTTATVTGTFSSMLVYVDASSTATKIYLGLYADNNGHPGALLTQGNKTSSYGRSLEHDFR